MKGFNIRKVKILIIVILLDLLQSNDFLILAQNNSHFNSIGGTIQLSFEELSFVEKAYHNSKLVDIEKNAGICLSYKVGFYQQFRLNSTFQFKYAFGYKWINAEFDYTEMGSSNFDYLEMGFSHIKSGYICFSLGVSYKKEYSKRIFFVPNLSLGANILTEKKEKLFPNKNTFSLIQNPYSDFYFIVPEISLDFLLFYGFDKTDFDIFFGPFIRNNLKYYHEDIGFLSAPISFGLMLGISKNK